MSIVASRPPAAASDIAVPPGVGGLLPGLLAEQPLPALAARVAAWLSARFARPLKLADLVVVIDHAQATEVLARDLDFRIAPINAARIDAVNGPFVLGMDRDAVLAHERRALYAALARIDLAPLRAAVAAEAAERVAAAGGAIDVVGDYARPIAAHTAWRLFGVKGPDERTFMDVARAIFAHTFLNVAGDKAVEARALRAAALMHDWLQGEIAARRASGALGADLMGALLAAGTLDDDGVRRSLGGMLVGSVDTTASAVAKIVAMLGRTPRLKVAVAADRHDPQRLLGWCLDVLRRWPHNPILLRRAAADTTLAGVAIAAGDTVVVWTQAAMQDPGAFPDPGRLRPDRPLAGYLHFGGGLHPCAGRLVNAFQIPLLVGALLDRGIGSVGPVQWAGPFPDHLTVQFGR